MIIDAKDLIAGRLATYAAKQALLGETVDIVNAEGAVLSGSPKGLLEKFKHRRERGDPHHGPYYPRMPHMMLKRMIKNMLPYKKSRGKDALKRIKCHLGVPPEFEGKDFVVIDSARKEKLPTKKYITLSKLSKLLGAKNE